MKNFIQELKRRHVIKASLAYLVIAWVLLEGLAFLLPMFGAPEWVLEGITLLMAIGLPIWIIISWVYDIRPEGIEKTLQVSENELVAEATNKRLNLFIIVSLSIAVIVMGIKLSNVFSSDHDKRFGIAVLPFKDLSPTDTQWFSDGVMDEVLKHFSSMKNLRVISRTSSDTYNGTDKKASEIAKELDVDYVLEGSVTLINNKVKIITQLISANDECVWSKEYDDNFDDIFMIQQNVSKEVLQELKITLSDKEKKIIERIHTENVVAYHLVLKGRSLLKNHTQKELEKSIELYEQAIALDSNYALAYAEIAQSYFHLKNKGHHFNNSLDSAKTYVEKALSMDPNTFRAYAVRARIFDYYQQWDKCNENFEKAIALNPNDAKVHAQYSIYFRAINDDYNARVQLEIAQRLDPLNTSLGLFLFDAYIADREIEKVEEYFDQWGFIYLKEDQVKCKELIKVFKNKDWSESVPFFEEELKKEPNNAILNRYLAQAYNGILNDNINFLKYSKKAYQLDSASSTNLRVYYDALLENNKSRVAKSLLQSQHVKSILNEHNQKKYLWYYFYHQKEYEKAKEILEDSLLMHRRFDHGLTYAQLENRKKVDSILSLKRAYLPNRHKAFFYAVLKEKDSMYYYLEKIDNPNLIKIPNSRREFDPYRKEERFKAVLRKNYFPLTHLNE